MHAIHAYIPCMQPCGLLLLLLMGSHTVPHSLSFSTAHQHGLQIRIICMKLDNSAQGSVRILTGMFYKNSTPSNMPDWQPFWRRIDRYCDNTGLSQILQPLILLSCYHVCLFASLLTNWAYLLRLPAECPWLCYAVPAVPLSYRSWKMGMSVNHRASFLGMIFFYISVRGLPCCTLILSISSCPLLSPSSLSFQLT